MSEAPQVSLFSRVRRQARLGASVLALGLLAAGCQTDDMFGAPPETVSQIRDIPADKINTDSRRYAALAIAALKKEDLDNASKFINNALRLEINNSYLQFLNGYVYHQQVSNGDVTKAEMAKQGYELAIQFDATNWLARYHLGLIYLDQREYAGAQKHFAEAMHYNADDPGLLYNLAISSYYAQDPVTADGALRHLRALPGYGQDRRVLRASSMVLAALNKPKEAKRFFDLYKDAPGAKTAFVGRRLRDWHQFHEGFGKRTPAQMVQVEPLPDPNQPADAMMGQPADAMGAPGFGEQQAQDQQPGFEQDAAEQPQEEPAPIDENGMVIVDVVIIRTEESYTTSKGVNLLNGLQLQFGGSNADTAGLSYTKTQQPLGNSVDPGTGTILIRRLTIPAITYSLNIANTNTTRNEILARPTLVALNGQPSEFFSGVEINAAAVGGNNGDGSTVQIEKEIGVKLTVTPEFLEDGRVKLAVTAERTFLTTPNTSSVTFTLRIDTSKTNVNANVAMNYGETLILSGLSEKETERKRDGVPGLQDVPGVQYLFSNRTTTDFQKSVLILLTPRPTQYIFQSERNRKKGTQRLSRDERVLSELQARYSDWFRPYPNWASVFHHMQANKLYREFRTGDVALEKWENLETRRNRLNQALDFLFF